MKFFRYFALIFIMLDGCIDPIHLKTTRTKSLVVDGLISDQPGPYTVLLTYSNAVNEALFEPEKVSGAAVQIVSDAGDTEQLIESKPGVFVTKTIQGMIGVTYTLKISLHEFTYESLPEKILPVGEFSELYFDFMNVEDPTKTDYLHTKNGFRLLANSEVLPEQGGRVRWRWRGTYEILTFPQLREKSINPPYGFGAAAWVADPPPCAGTFICQCCTCWVSTFNNGVLLSDLRLNGSSHLSGHVIDFIPATRRFFYTKYKIEVDQMSLSKNIFNYWKRIEAQSVSGSDLFQTPPPITQGNMVATSANTPQALGIFAASSVKTKKITISRSDVPYALPYVDIIKESCKAAFLHSTNVRPPNW